MMWFWLACSSYEMKTASDEYTLGMDSGFYSDTGMMENDAAEDASPGGSALGKKFPLTSYRRRKN